MSRPSWHVVSYIRRRIRSGKFGQHLGQTNRWRDRRRRGRGREICQEQLVGHELYWVGEDTPEQIRSDPGRSRAVRADQYYSEQRRYKSRLEPVQAPLSFGLAGSPQLQGLLLGV